MISRFGVLLTYAITFFLVMFVSWPHAIDSAETDFKGLVLSGKLEDGIRVIEVVAYKYGFFPNPIVVKHGERVKLIMTAMDVRHGFYVPEFNVNEVLPRRGTRTVEFVAYRKGQFMVHCSVYCGPDHGKQKTRLIVE
jgi:cytochrome c oxidase subunit 2